MRLLEVKDLKVTYTRPNGNPFTVIHIPEFDIKEGEQMALKGRSGSGKTSLLNAISGILGLYEGSVLLLGKELKNLKEAERDTFRGKNIGFIFQTFHLLQGFTALQNVVLGSVFAGNPDEETSVTLQRARELLKRVGLSDREHHHPRMMSSGEQQRVAIARALINKPKLILADEPTGSLDEKNGGEVIDLIKELCSASGASLLLATHDPVVMGGFARVVDLKELNRV
jgi:ABC-type lipoprotein export system ATPase subunit